MVLGFFSEGPLASAVYRPMETDSRAEGIFSLNRPAAMEEIGVDAQRIDVQDPTIEATHPPPLQHYDSSRDDDFGFLTVKSKSRKQKTVKKRNADVWDIFLSYRVATDKKLVQDIFWRLRALDVVIDGKQRKLNVFW